METLNLTCEKRELGTKGKVRALRREGKVPAVVYGPKTVATPIAVAGYPASRPRSPGTPPSG